ncbi:MULTISPECIES: DUF5803 family protein [Halorussus]|uniref:DUF5803 family protein n=1 Tax=Halorussus TaxID=1070314 RepID=UPI000E21571C|nr:MULTISPECIES: DUF5803 family protein [Halorussus]NHN59041.1 hypothetical protein [Halorussus sp. JP-T4]
MNRRLSLAFASVALLALTAGCTGLFGGDQISEKRLEGDGNTTYDWDNTATVTLNVTGGEYRAVYDFDNRTELRVFERESLGEKTPVNVGTVRFRYDNGTVVTLGQENVRKTKSNTVITLPASEGQLAYTAPHRGKSFTTPTYVHDSYEVILPKGMRVGTPILSQVRPSADGRSQLGGRVHLSWAEVTADSVVVRYYLARDLTIFAGIIGASVLVALVGLAYFRLQIRRLEQEREEMGLNVDTDSDEFDQGPPPGMG